MRKCTAFLLSLCIAVSMLIPGFRVDAAYAPDFTVNSATALLIDKDTEKVIFSKNPDMVCYPASLVKIMTCLITLENVPETELATTMVTAPYSVFNELYGRGASTADIRPQETLSVQDLLYAMMLQSACEAAGILADFVGKGETAEDRMADFVRMMNDKAKEIGCTNTVYRNAHGLHDPDQHTTANDQWKILQYAFKNYPLFEKISTTVRYTMSATNKHSSERNVLHTNDMLRSGKYYYANAKGIKTGTTSESGKNLITEATSNNYTYVLITMHAPTKYDNGEPISDNLSYLDHKNIYKWVFGTFELKTVLNENSTAAQVKVTLGKDKDTLLLAPQKEVLSLLPKKADISSVLKIPHVPESVEAPIEKGQQIGTLDLKLNDEVIATVPLVAYESVERSTFLYVMAQIKSFFGSVWFKGALIVIVVFLAVYITLIIRYNKKKKKARRVYPRRRI